MLCSNSSIRKHSTSSLFNKLDSSSLLRENLSVDLALFLLLHMPLGNVFIKYLNRNLISFDCEFSFCFASFHLCIYSGKHIGLICKLAARIRSGVATLANEYILHSSNTQGGGERGEIFQI